MSSYHPFAARPSLTKRHTSPSPAVLLSLPTLEALPPTPRSAKSYEPLNDFAPSTSASRSHSHRQAKSISLSSKMPLIKPRSKRPTSPRSEHYSFLPSIVSALDPRGSSSSGSQKHSRNKSRSQPPPASPNFPSSNDFEFNIPQSFSSSTPPSTYSKGTSSLNALPSIQGVFDSYEDGNGAQRKEKGRFKKEKRDTLKLPMMNPSIRDRHPFNEKEQEENWHWNGFNQPAEVVITREAERSSTNHDQSVPRRRNTSLSINTHFARPANSREHSSSSQNASSSHSHSHHSLPAQSRSSNRSSLVAEERSPLTHWLGPEEEDLDDVELQALNVLENLSGHLMRDGFGYGTGAYANTSKPEAVPSLTRSGNSTPSKTRSRSTTYSTQATSEIDNTKRYSQVSDSPSIREWRENRKRTKSQGHALGRPVSEQQQPTQTHTRGSMSISRRPPPPPPPPEGSLPPLPTHATPIQSQTHTIKNNKYIVVNDESIVTDQVNFIQEENNKKSVRSGSSSGYNNNTSIPQPPPPIPPRSASRLDSHASASASASVHRSSSASQLRPRSQTPVQRKGSKEKQGVRVPLVFSTTSSPAVTTREEEEHLVVVIDKRPPTPAREMSSPTIPVHQRPLPPLPTLPDLSSLPTSPQPQRSALAQLAHPRLPTRLLRPKRPSTAGNPTPTPLHEISKPLTRLVPREEPRRLSSSSRVEGTEGRKNGITALSFLALDDAAVANLSARSTAGRSGRTSSFDGSSGYGNGQARMESPTQGLLDAGYIIPPSERSKIGVDDRKESRRRRKESQSSLSSIAGSEITNVNVIDHDVVEVEGVEVAGQGEGEDWTTAYEYGQSKVKQRLKEKELRLSLDIGLRPTSTSPIRSKPPPLNIFSLNDYSITRGEDEDEIRYPKSAGLLPPPRPRRKTTPSAPPQLIVQPKSPVSPKSKTPAGLGLGYGQLSPKYTHRSISIQQEQEDEVEDGFKEFMDLNSPILPSPNLTTPGQAYVFPPSSSRDLDVEDTLSGMVQERKVSTTSTQRTNQSDSNSSNWSNDTYERERKLITSLWLSSKPTRSTRPPAATKNHEGAREGEAQQHPFYSLGRLNKLASTPHGNGKGTVVVDGGYGRRNDFGVKI